MFDALVNEGEIVRLPSGRQGVVDGYEGGAPFGRYIDDGDEWQCKSKLLRHVTSKLAGMPAMFYGGSDEARKVEAEEIQAGPALSTPAQ